MFPAASKSLFWCKDSREGEDVVLHETSATSPLTMKLGVAILFFGDLNTRTRPVIKTIQPIV